MATILIVIFSTIGVLVCGLLLLLREAHRHPPGFEDNRGFHSEGPQGEAEEF